MNRQDTVKWFSKEMLKKLDANTHKKHWRYLNDSQLFDLLNREVAELRLTLRVGQSCYDTIKEASDVANISMMIADNARRQVEGAAHIQAEKEAGK